MSEWKAIEWSCHAPTTVVVDDPSSITGKRVIAECREVDDARLIAAARELFAALNELHGLFDQQTYDETLAMEFEVPDDHEYSVWVTAKQLRAVNQAILKAEGKL